MLPAQWALSTSFTGCLPFCVKLLLYYYCLLSLWRNKYDDDDGGGGDDDALEVSFWAITTVVKLSTEVYNIDYVRRLVDTGYTPYAKRIYF